MPTNKTTPSGSNGKEARTLRRRIIGIVFLSAISLLTYFLVSDYYTSIDHAEKIVLQNLQGIVKDLSLRIDGDAHELMTRSLSHKDNISASDQNETYQNIHRLLELTLQAHELNSPIYTFVKSDKDYPPLEFVATSSNVPYYRHGYDSFPKEVLSSLDQGGTIELYEDDYGHWLSAFAPIKNSKGEIIAYVQADRQFDDFIKEVKAKTVRNAILCLIGFLIISILVFPYLRQILKKEEERQNILQTSLHEKQQLSEKLEKNELQLKTYASKLELSNKELSDFAHIASHDLKSPIRNIHAFAQLIKKRQAGVNDKDTEEYLDFIINSAHRATNLINGLLSYSSTEKDMGEQKRFNLSLSALQAQSNLHSIIEEKQVKICTCQLPYIVANPMLITQVFQNLIGNGIKYNKAEIPAIEIRKGHSEEKGTYFYVKDNGIGIPEEFQDRVFKMFTRLHSSEEYEGSGIGLAFCKRVVNAYGGEMWLESKPGVGTTIFFTLPNAMIKEEASQTLEKATAF